VPVVEPFFGIGFMIQLKGFCRLRICRVAARPCYRFFGIALGEPLALPKQHLVFEPSLCAAALAQSYRPGKFSALYQF
jgi:hypothetical protein